MATICGKASYPPLCFASIQTGGVLATAGYIESVMADTGKQTAKKDEESVFDNIGGAMSKGASAVTTRFVQLLRNFCHLLITTRVQKTNIKVILGIMKALNIINAILLGFSGVLCYMIIDGSVTRFFLATYIM